MATSRPSYQLAAGTSVVTKNGGAVTFVSIVAAGADATVDLHDCEVAGDVATTNKMAAFKVDVSLNGYQGGGNITHPLRFTTGLTVVVTGIGAIAFVGFTKG